MKSEQTCFSIDDLEKAPKKTTFWDGVRNYQARNMMRDSIKKGDQVFFYHSNSEPSAIAGIAEVVKEGYPDHTAFDPDDQHFDPKSNKKEPTHEKCYAFAQLQHRAVNRSNAKKR